MTSDPIIDPTQKIPLPQENSDVPEFAPERQDEQSTDPIDNHTKTIAEIKEQLARAQSDYSNLVRRSREESAQIGQWTEDKTILKFLPILDNLERSLEHIPAELVDNPWVEGNKSIVRGMQKVIAEFGLTPMNPIGQEVDANLHDVISQIPHKLTTIQAEVEKGYMRGTKALRHAKVIVGDGQLASE